MSLAAGVSGGPAARFTQLCLRSRIEAAALEEARTLADGLDWDAWHEVAQAAGLTPLLYRILHGREIAPVAAEDRLRTAYYQSARASLLRWRELARSLRTLAAEGVQVILLKGAALAEPVYGDVAVRPMIDLDLLVRREDFTSVLGLLTGLGYTPMSAETHAGDATAFENEVALRKHGPVDTLIDIHWSLLNSPHYQRLLPMAWFWETSVEAEVDGAPVLLLSPEATLLHLAAHLALHHRGEGLLWLQDVAELLHAQRERLDWDQVIDRCQAFDLVLPLQQVLPRVERDWGAPIPGEAMARILALEPSPGEARVHAWLTAEHRPVAQRFWADLASMPGWRQRLRYGLGNLFPSVDYMVRRYRIRHPLLAPFYYPYRWLVGLRGAWRGPRS